MARRVILLLALWAAAAGAAWTSGSKPEPQPQPQQQHVISSAKFTGGAPQPTNSGGSWCHQRSKDLVHSIWQRKTQATDSMPANENVPPSLPWDVPARPLKATYSVKTDDAWSGEIPSSI